MLPVSNGASAWVELCFLRNVRLPPEGHIVKVVSPPFWFSICYGVREAIIFTFYISFLEYYSKVNKLADTSWAKYQWMDERDNFSIVSTNTKEGFSMSLSWYNRTKDPNLIRLDLFMPGNRSFVSIQASVAVNKPEQLGWLGYGLIFRELGYETLVLPDGKNISLTGMEVFYLSYNETGPLNLLFKGPDNASLSIYVLSHLAMLTVNLKYKYLIIWTDCINSIGLYPVICLRAS